MTFGHPQALWLLLPLIFMLLLDAGMRRARRRRLDRFIPPELRDRMQPERGPALYSLRAGLCYLGLLLIGFSLSCPQWGYQWRELNREGLDLMVVVDTSNSMRADDFQPSRLQRAKWGIEEFVSALRGDRTGLVAFAGDAVLLCPLTADTAAFMMVVQDLVPGIAPRGGTNLAVGLQKALDSFEKQEEADRVILLITDGESHEGELAPLLARMEKEEIRVFAVGIGTPEGSLIPLDANANQFLQNRNQEVVKSRLDEETLRLLARRTGGIYVRASPGDFGVRQLLEDGLAPLRRRQLETTRVREMEERFQWFLGAGLLCLLLEGWARIPGGLRKRRST